MRAQVILILGALIPTILTTPLAILLLVSGDLTRIEIVLGVLVLAFAASAVTGFLIGGVFLRRGSALVKVQHDFLSSASHELRTPMTSLRMFTDALLDDRLTDPEERANCLRVIRHEVDRLDDLVGRLIELSRLETEHIPYERIPLEIERVVQDALATFQGRQLIEKSQLHVDVDSDLLVVGDRVALVQVLVNLLSNAWKYSGESREILCSAKPSKDNKGVELIVADNGPGIPVEEQKRLFEKFWRGKDAIESGTSGSGLGLTIVEAIVKAHRGRIEFKSPPGGGASFHVFLPRAKAT